MPNSPISKSIPESILRTAARIKTLSDRFVFNPVGMTTSTFRILNLLYESKNNSLTPGELLKFSGGTKSNMSQRLNFLEKQDYIKRVGGKGGEDRRKVFVELTSKGKSLVKNINTRTARVKNRLERDFPKQEINQYFDFIAQVNQFLDEGEGEIEELLRV